MICTPGDCIAKTTLGAPAIAIVASLALAVELFHGACSKYTTLYLARLSRTRLDHKADTYG